MIVSETVVSELTLQNTPSSTSRHIEKVDMTDTQLVILLHCQLRCFIHERTLAPAARRNNDCIAQRYKVPNQVGCFNLSVYEILIGHYSTICKRSIHTFLLNVNLLELYVISKVPYIPLTP